MTTKAEVQLTSSELGILWNSYLGLSGRILFYEFFGATTQDTEAKDIITSAITEFKNIQNEIKDIFINENAVIPFEFNEQDIFMGSSSLFNDTFHIIFLRQMTKMAFGFDAVFTGITYRNEVQNVFKLHYDTVYKFYTICTDYLLENGLLAKPPIATIPTEVEFVEDKSYMSGINIFSDKRILNTIEVGYIHEALEFNVFFMNLLTGFAQVAQENDVKKYFAKGVELAKKNIEKVSDVLIQSNIEPSSTRSGKATDSTQPPFSDKLMMYITSLLTTTPLSYSGLGTSFSFRNDLPLLLGLMAKDLFTYAKDGGKLMVEHKWMVEPPQM